MSKLLDRIRSRLQLTVEQERKLIQVLVSVTVTVLVPTVLLWLLVRAYFLELFLGVIVVNLGIRYGRRTLQFLTGAIDRRDQAKLAATAKKHREMIHHVRPSLFTLRYSKFEEDELLEKTYIDDRQHWVVAIRLFFNPFAERRGAPPPGQIANLGYVAVRALVRVVTLVWLITWACVVILTILTTFSGVLPRFTTEYIAAARQVLVVLFIVMIVWTILWLWYAIRLWGRERFTVTDNSYAITSRRLPFQNSEDSDGATTYLQSVSLTVTFVGWLFGYGHLTFKSWQDPEPIAERRFVAHPERAKVILDSFAARNSKEGRTPLKARG